MTMPTKWPAATETEPAPARIWEWYWDALGLTVQVNPSGSGYRQRLADGLAVAEALQAVSGIRVALADALAVADLLALTAGPVLLLERIGPADRLEARYRGRAALQDRALPNDAAPLLLETAGLTLADAVVTSDALATALRGMASLADTAAPVDLLELGVRARLGDLAQPLFNLAVVLRARGALTERVDGGLAELLTARAGYRAALADAALPQDVIDRARVSYLLRDSLLTGVTDSIAVTFRYRATPASEAALPGDALGYSLQRPRQWQATLADAALPLDGGYGLEMMASAGLADRTAPADYRLAAQLTQHQQHFTAAQADAIEPAPPLSLAAVPGAPIMAFMVETDPAPIDRFDRYTPFAEGGWGDAGRIVAGSEVYDFGAVGSHVVGELGLARIRFLMGASDVRVIINHRLHQDADIENAWQTGDSILLIDEWGDVLYLGAAPAAHSGLQLDFSAEGFTFVRFSTSDPALVAHARQFYQRLGLSRRFVVAWYQQGTPPAGYLPRAGYGDRLDARLDEQAHALADAALPADWPLIALAEDEADLRDAAPPADALGVGSSYQVAQADAAPPGDAPLIYTLRQPTAHQYHAHLADTAAPVEGLTLEAELSVALADGAVARDGATQTHLLHPQQHGVGLSDTILPGDAALRAAVYRSRALNSRALNDARLN